MDAVAVAVASAAGAAAGWFVGPVADAIAGPRYGPESPDHDPEDTALALLAAPTTARTRVVATVVTAAAIGLLASAMPRGDMTVYFAVLVWAYAVAAVVDLQYLRLPDVVVWPAAAVAVAGSFAICARLPGDLIEAAVPGPFIAAGAAVFLLAVSLLFSVLRGVEAFGLGDVKLELSLATSVAWLGWASDEEVIGPLRLVVLALLAGFAIGTVVGLPAAGFERKRHIPFGPFLMLGWYVIVLVEAPS